MPISKPTTLSIFKYDNALITGFDESDLPEKSADIAQIPKVNKTLVPVEKQSAVIGSLIEHLCSLYESDEKRSKRIYYMLCKYLCELGIVTPVAYLEEFTSVRTQYKSILYNIIQSSLTNIDTSPSIPGPAHAFPLVKKAGSLEGIFVDPNKVFDFNLSRYKSEFVENGILGSGGYGSVYRARNKIDGQEYAIKRIPLSTSDQKNCKVMLREVKILASLNHANIVRYHNAWIEHDHHSSIDEEDIDSSGPKKRSTDEAVSNSIEQKQDDLFDLERSLSKTGTCKVNGMQSNEVYLEEHFNLKANFNLDISGILRNEASGDSFGSSETQHLVRCKCCGNEIEERREKRSKFFASGSDSSSSDGSDEMLDKEVAECSKTQVDDLKVLDGIPINAKRISKVNEKSSSLFFLGSNSDREESEELSDKPEADTGGMKCPDCSKYRAKTGASPPEGGIILTHGVRREMEMRRVQSFVFTKKQLNGSVFSTVPLAAGHRSKRSHSHTTLQNHFKEACEKELQEAKKTVVVPLKKILTSKAVLYIQMELCQTSLKRWLTERNVNVTQNAETFDERVALHIMKQILLALSFIHSKRLIHRDIKPRNIFLKGTELPHVRLGDFGLARKDILSSNFEPMTPLVTSCKRPSFNRRSSHTSGVGTTTYAAPEQLNEDDYDAKVDIYSFGILTFELWTVFGTAMERAESIKNLRKLLIPEKLSKDYPALTELIKSLISKDPKSRPEAKTILQSPFLENTKDKVIDAQAKEIAVLRRDLEAIKTECGLLKNRNQELADTNMQLQNLVSKLQKASNYDCST